MLASSSSQHVESDSRDFGNPYRFTVSSSRFNRLDREDRGTRGRCTPYRHRIGPVTSPQAKRAWLHGDHGARQPSSSAPSPDRKGRAGSL